MIYIANPIYDVVFKYLLEDLDIAKGLLSRIIDEEIESLEVQSQETMAEVVLLQHPALRLLRLDFKAVICKKNPLYREEDKDSKVPKFLRKKILIELQKAKELFDIMRFRKYLGENYSKEDTFIDENGLNKTDSLPIICVYFLGFGLQGVPFGVLKVGREFEDVLGKKRVFLPVLDPFISALTHESYMIQLRRLDPYYKTPLENILMLFNQKFILKTDPHKLQIEHDNLEDELVEKAERRLLRAISDEELRKKMDVEDEMERTILRKLKEQEIELAEKDIIIEQKDTALAAALAEKDTALAEKHTALAEKDTALAEERRQNIEQAALLAQFAAEIEALKKAKE